MAGLRAEEFTVEAGSGSVYNNTDESLDTWHLQLTDVGVRIIIESRSNYVDKITEKLTGQDHFFARDILEIPFVAFIEIFPQATLVDIRDQLLKELTQNRDKESSVGRSLIGPQRDEIPLEIDGSPRCASTGQLGVH